MSLKLVFITNVPDSVGRIRLQEEAEKRGHSLTFRSKSSTEIRPGFTEELASEFADFDIVYFAGGLGTAITSRVQAALESCGVYCFNSYVRRDVRADDKVYQALVFNDAGLPTPRTVRAVRPDFNLLTQTLAWPMVAKRPKSSQGKGVHLLRDEADASQLQRGKEYLFQQYIEYEADYRVHVIGGKTFCPYRRIPPTDDFRANVSLGGSLEKVSDEQILKEISELAVRTAQAMGLEFCAVDMIQDKNGQFFVLETNSDPGFKNVEEVTGESFASVIFDYWESCVQ